MYATKTVSSQTTSAWIPMDDNQAAFNASITVTVTGTLTYSVEFTLDNVQDPTVTPAVFSTTLVGATTSQSLAIHYPVKAFRLNVTAFTTGSAVITVLQGSSWDGAATVGNNLVEELANIYSPKPFPGFIPSLFSALVTSSTAACTSEVVTVTATAHGIPATVFDQYRFYYPGSPSLAAGWYNNFTRTGADTITFSAPGSSNFTSESVNSGAIVTAEVTMATVTIPGNTVVAGNIVTAKFCRLGDSVASSKTTRMRLDGSLLANVSISSTSTNGVISLSFGVPSLDKQEGAGLEGSLNVTRYSLTKNLRLNQDLTITSTLTAAAQYTAIAVAALRIE